MRLSNSFIPTLKEIPSDAYIPSHQLMLRAGMIRPLGAGVYSFLPLGYRLVKKIIEIIRDEMDAIGGQEFHLPALNPLELWEETGRAKDFGDVLFHIKNRPLVLAPTHEEVIGYIASNHIKSYRDLPQIWYQIQTKFRNEPRPRSGVIRGRQFLMKDSYSLDATWEGLDRSYELHAEAYKKIFTRCGLRFFVVGASSGAMGGSASQEFMIESQSGEDTCVRCDNCGYAANLEVAQSNVAKPQRDGQSNKLKEIYTPNVRTIDELKSFLNVDERLLAKSLIYMKDKTPILILMMGNDQLNESKLQAVLGADVRPSVPEELKGLTGADAGSIGPVGLNDQLPEGTRFKIIVDKRLEGANNLISGANKNDYHITNIDLQRDVKVDGYYDLRIVQAGEPCPSCGKPLRIVNAIELGHIFKLGTKYAESLDAYFLDEDGKEQPIIMGSYGIGVERIMACHIEQSHDKHGIIWNKALAPFHVHLILLNANNEKVVSTAEHLYEKFQEALIDVLYDDRDDVSPGFKFKDADLLGMPLQVIVGKKNVDSGKVEVKERETGKRKLVELGKIVHYVEQYIES
ncbi:MAG: proline--tRNA ligase [Ignavibacteriae bacterium]|nr:proline--tRNA ligase [Ignavibacteriota bacterium]